MPFADRSFDFLVCRAALRNFADPLGALREMDRVLKPGGRGLIIELRRDALMVDIAEYVDSLEVSFLSRLFIGASARNGRLRATEG
jgi:ubiquinone/menaquinone biosynthesis C-methylase UbiE